MKFCPYCGAPTEAGNKFCMACGHSLQEVAQQLASAPEETEAPVAEVSIPEPVVEIPAEEPAAVEIPAEVPQEPVYVPQEPVEAPQEPVYVPPVPPVQPPYGCQEQAYAPQQGYIPPQPGYYQPPYGYQPPAQPVYGYQQPIYSYEPVPAYNPQQPGYAPYNPYQQPPQPSGAVATAPVRPAGASAIQLPTGRSLVKMLFLGLITLGIYPIAIWSRMVQEMNIVASRYDGKRTVSYFGMCMLAPLTLLIYPIVWQHKLCNRMGAELSRRGIGYQFNASTMWLWGALGSLILVGPFVYCHKMMKAINLINADFNAKG